MSESAPDPLAVCTLPADGLSERLAWVRSQILPHAVASERLPDGFAWELEDAPGLAERLDTLVALERECCSGIAFIHRPGRASGRRRLEVRGVDPRAPVFASVQVQSGEPTRLAARALGAVGAGALAAFLVCCVLPIAAAAILGATVAAPLAGLDSPGTIAIVAAISGGALFAWQARRRRATAPHDVAAPSCGRGC